MALGQPVDRLVPVPAGIERIVPLGEADLAQECRDGLVVGQQRAIEVVGVPVDEDGTQVEHDGRRDGDR
jgi:hypothetical protein